MTYSKQIKLQVVKAYWSCGGSLTNARRFLKKKDGAKFRTLTDQMIRRMVKKLEKDCTMEKGHSSGRPKSALSDKNIARVQQKLEHSPRRSTRRVSKELKLSQTSVWRILRRELKKFAYKIQLKQAQTPKNRQERVDFSNKMSDHMEADPEFLKSIIFSDEAHFHLNGHVNRQNCRFWASENPRASVESPNSREKVTVWMGIGYPGTYGPYFFEDSATGKATTINTANYMDMLKQKFIPILKRNRVFDSCWFMQDGAPPHCSKDSLAWLETQFGSRIISRRSEFAWPPYSPDLNPCDFYLWGYLKSKVYSDPVPKTIEQLKENIIREVRKIKRSSIKAAIDNSLPRYQHVLSHKGQWVEQILNY